MTGWRIGFASNPVLAPLFTRWITNTESCASQISQWAAVEAINGPQDAAEAMKGELPRAARPDRAPAERGSGRQLPGARRGVLRLAQRDRGLPHDRRAGFGGIQEAPAERGGRRAAGRHPFRHARARARGSTCAFPTPPPRTRSRRASRAWRLSSARTPRRPHERGLAPERHGRGGHRARRQVPLRGGDRRRPARAQPAGGPSRPRRVAARGLRARDAGGDRARARAERAGGDLPLAPRAFGHDFPALRLRRTRDAGPTLRASWTRRSSPRTGSRPQELAARHAMHRSPLVARCVADYLAGARFPLDVLSREFA